MFYLLLTVPALWRRLHNPGGPQHAQSWGPFRTSLSVPAVPTLPFTLNKPPVTVTTHRVSQFIIFSCHVGQLFKDCIFPHCTYSGACKLLSPFSILIHPPSFHVLLCFGPSQAFHLKIIKLIYLLLQENELSYHPFPPLLCSFDILSSSTVTRSFWLPIHIRLYHPITFSFVLTRWVRLSCDTGSQV